MAIINVKQQQESANKDNLEYQKIKAQNAVKTKAQSSIDDMTKYTPDYELQTFDIQQTEWVTWSQDNTKLTPNCDRIALGRGMDRVELLTRVGLKVSIVFDVLGAQQGQVDLIEACTTMTELNALLASAQTPSE